MNFRNFFVLLIENKKTLLFAWILMQSFVFAIYGINSGEESIKYISQAEVFLSTGTLSTSNFWLYFFEIFLIAFAIKLKLGFIFVVAVQLLLNGIATIMLYRLSIHLLKNKFLGSLSTLLFIASVFLQTYNFYLFTESCFYSLTIIFSSYLLLLQKFSVKAGISILFFLLLLAITRPTGILFLPVTVTYLFLNFLQQISIKVKLLIIGAGIVVFLFLLNIMTQSGGELDFMLPFRDERIICGVPTIAEIPIKTIDHGNSLEGIFYYITHNTEQFVRLAWLKTLAFFGLTRSYYSSLHNLYLAIFYYPFYFLSILFFLRNYKKLNLAHMYLILIILFFWLTTVFTCDDWHNRFFLTITAYIFILGLSAIKEKKINL